MLRYGSKRTARWSAGLAALALWSQPGNATVLEFDDAGVVSTRPSINYIQRAQLAQIPAVGRRDEASARTAPTEHLETGYNAPNYIEHIVNNKFHSVGIVASSAGAKTPPMVVASLPDISKLPAAAFTYVDVPPRPKAKRHLETKAAETAATHAIPADLFLALIEAESGFDPNAISPKGAIGLTQLMPATAKSLGVDPHDPEQNLSGGARYLRQQFERFGTWPLALAAYNAGPTRVAKLGRIPNINETKAFVARVMAASGLDSKPLTTASN